MKSLLKIQNLPLKQRLIKIHSNLSDASKIKTIIKKGDKISSLRGNMPLLTSKENCMDSPSPPGCLQSFAGHLFSSHSYCTAGWALVCSSLCWAFQEGRCLCNNESQIRRDKCLVLIKTAILAVQLTTSSKGCIPGNQFRKHVPQAKLGYKHTLRLKELKICNELLASTLSIKDTKFIKMVEHSKVCSQDIQPVSEGSQRILMV